MQSDTAGVGHVTELSCGGGGLLENGVRWEARIRGAYSSFVVNRVPTATTGGVTATGLQFSMVVSELKPGDVIRAVAPL